MQVYFWTLFFCLLLGITGFVPMESTRMPAKYGNPVTLHCNETEKPVSYIEWLYKNETWPNAKESRIFSRAENTTENKWEKIGLIYSDEDFKNGKFCITIRSITYKYEGEYKCRTQIKEMNAKIKSRIIVKVIDCIENKTPVTYIYWKYKNVTKNVTWKDIFWCINNKNKTYAPFENVIYPAGDFKTGNYSITLRSITFEYDGQYVCYTQINGSGANQTSPVFDINVVSWEQCLNVLPGHTLNLYLHTNESVQLHFWKNGEKRNVGTIQVNSQKCDLDNRYKNRSEMDNEVLRIHYVTLADNGTYTVQDEHSGKNISTVTVKITDAKDLSNRCSKNSTDQGTQIAAGNNCMVIGSIGSIGSIVFVLCIIGVSIYLCRKKNCIEICGQRNGSRSISYQSTPGEEEIQIR